MPTRLEQEISRSLDASPALLPLLPDLLQDLTELGSSAPLIIEILVELGVGPNARVLDLGCGKGSVALALAREIGAQVHGIDAFDPFIEEASRRAAAQGLSSRCTFEHADLRRALEREQTVDVVLMLGLGPVLGDTAQTIGRLRRIVRPGGLMVLDEAYLPEPSGGLERSEGRNRHDEIVALLEAHGDALIRESVPSVEQVRAFDQWATQSIERRANELLPNHPELEAEIRSYVESQKRESETLDASTIPTIWVLRRQ